MYRGILPVYPTCNLVFMGPDTRSCFISTSNSFDFLSLFKKLRQARMTETEELEEKGMLLNDPYLSSKSGRFDIDADSEANLRGDSRTNLLGDNFKNGTNITVVPDMYFTQIKIRISKHYHFYHV
nr:ADM_HP1_G0046430.mRNA.1.CDS.1 [Saccharomyces cerevisiae]